MSHVETMRIAKTQDLSDPFITAGSRAYIICAQHGGFPQIGSHTPGEMGGIWAHPIKLLDGFWLRVDGEWLARADRFISGALACSQEYTLEGGVVVERLQFVPDDEPAVVVRYCFRAGTPRRLSLHLAVRTNLQMVWPSRDDGPDEAEYAVELAAWVCRNVRHPWCVMVGVSNLEPTHWTSGETVTIPERQHGNGVSIAFDFVIDVGPDRAVQLELVIAGSSVGSEEATEAFRRVRGQTRELWNQKQLRYELLLARSSLSIPDPSIERAWDWMKCTVDWLYREVPGVGSGICGGVEEYPWWFGCDSAYAVLGALALGQHETAITTLDFLRTASMRAYEGSGRVIHECNTAGEITTPASTAETPQLLTTIWDTFCWTGDRGFLQRCYDFCRRGLLEWTLGECSREGDLLPYGYGITERVGFDLQCIDTATHTVRALHALAKMSDALGDEDIAMQCRRLGAHARAQLEEAFWMEEEGMYGDMLATPNEMAQRLRQWLETQEDTYYGSANAESVRAELLRLLQHVESDGDPDRKRSWLLKYWIVLSPLQAQLAVPGRALRVLARLETSEFTGPWGMYISGLDRVNAMSISTGALAVAEASYGRIDEALRYVRVLTDTLDMHMPGSISELSPRSGCFAQAWSVYAVAWPLVAHVFGLQPKAHQQRLDMRPQFPVSWPEAHLTNVRIGGATFDFHWDGRRLLVQTDEPGWTVASSTVSIETRTA